jgi:hypothetical protein
VHFIDLEGSDNIIRIIDYPSKARLICLLSIACSLVDPVAFSEPAKSAKVNLEASFPSNKHFHQRCDVEIFFIDVVAFLNVITIINVILRRGTLFCHNAESRL